MPAAIELLALVIQLMSAAPSVIMSVTNASDALKRASDEGRDLNEEDWAAIRAAREALQAELLYAASHAPPSLAAGIPPIPAIPLQTAST